MLFNSAWRSWLERGFSVILYDISVCFPSAPSYFNVMFRFSTITQDERGRECESCPDLQNTNEAPSPPPPSLRQQKLTNETMKTNGFLLLLATSLHSTDAFMGIGSKSNRAAKATQLKAASGFKIGKTHTWHTCACVDELPTPLIMITP